jgi:hypothetical protein
MTSTHELASLLTTASENLRGGWRGQDERMRAAFRIAYELDEIAQALNRHEIELSSNPPSHAA